jgi:hypothetical protein
MGDTEPEALHVENVYIALRTGDAVCTFANTIVCPVRQETLSDEYTQIASRLSEVYSESPVCAPVMYNLDGSPWAGPVLAPRTGVYVQTVPDVINASLRRLHTVMFACMDGSAEDGVQAVVKVLKLSSDMLNATVAFAIEPQSTPSCEIIMRGVLEFARVHPSYAPPVYVYLYDNNDIKTARGLAGAGRESIHGHTRRVYVPRAAACSVHRRQLQQQRARRKQSR